MTEQGLDARSVTVRRSGGFAGISRSWALNLGDTDTELEGRVRALAAEAAAEQSAASRSGPGPVGVPADGFSYSVVLELGGGAAELQGVEPSLPGPLADLVDLVRTHGRPLSS